MASTSKQIVWLDEHSDRVRIEPMTPSTDPQAKITYLKEVQSQANRLKRQICISDKAGVKQLIDDIDCVPDVTMRSLIRVIGCHDDASELVQLDTQMTNEPAIYYLNRIFAGVTRCIDVYSNPLHKKHHHRI